MKVLRKGDKGEDVRALQQALGIVVDGIFGPKTEAAVKDWQRRHGLFPDGIVGAKTWKSLPLSPSEGGGNLKDTGATIKKSKRVIKKIIVHCTATPEGKEVSVKDIDAWHRARGFAGIGYHYVIHLDGRVENGRDVDISGAHCAGHNAYSIGVVYVGGIEATKNAKGQLVPKQDKNGNTIPKDTRTQAQKAALLSLLKEMRRLYPGATIHGHREFANKDCPSFDARGEYKNL